MISDDLKDCFRFARPRVRSADLVVSLMYVVAAPIVYLVELYLFMPTLGLELSRLGALWGVIAAVFVIHESPTESLKLTVTFLIGTTIAALVTLAYLLIFSFNVVGLAACLGAGALLCRMIGRRDAMIPASIAIAVILIVSGNPGTHAAWLNPALRFADSLIGCICSMLVVSLVSRLYRPSEPDSAKP